MILLAVHMAAVATAEAVEMAEGGPTAATRGSGDRRGSDSGGGGGSGSSRGRGIGYYSVDSQCFNIRKWLWLLSPSSTTSI